MAEFNACMKEFLRLCDEIGGKNYTIPEMLEFRQYLQVYVGNAKQKAVDIHFSDFDQVYDRNTRAINNGPEVTQWLTNGQIFIQNVSRNVRINLTWFYSQAVQKCEEARCLSNRLSKALEKNRQQQSQN